MSGTDTDTHGLSERCFSLCRTLTFLQRLGTWLDPACWSHEKSTGAFRSNHFSVPSLLVFFFCVGNMHVIHTCRCIYDSMNDEY